MHKSGNDKHKKQDILLTSRADLRCKPANHTKPFQSGYLGLRLTSPNVQCSLQAKGII